jgi:catechol 2,3-dioxygenase-like lactoylglutathione lyase family enzyme
MAASTATVRHVLIVSLPVCDQDRARRFYTDVLGFEVVADQSMGDMRWVQVRPPGAQTSLTLVTWFDSMPAGSARGIVLEVDDVAAFRDAVTRHGAEVGEIQRAPWGTFCEMSDPDGNGLVIQSTGR